MLHPKWVKKPFPDLTTRKLLGGRAFRGFRRFELKTLCFELKTIRTPRVHVHASWKLVSKNEVPRISCQDKNESQGVNRLGTTIIDKTPSPKTGSPRSWRWHAQASRNWTDIWKVHVNLEWGQEHLIFVARILRQWCPKFLPYTISKLQKSLSLPCALISCRTDQQMLLGRVQQK